MGRTGSGKSTTLLALFRMFELGKGKIIIDGVDVASISLKRLRNGGWVGGCWRVGKGCGKRSTEPRASWCLVPLDLLMHLLSMGPCQLLTS